MQLSTKLVEEFEKKIYYISEGIESFQRIYVFPISDQWYCHRIYL